jgi:AraC-like DNA-binding protein
MPELTQARSSTTESGVGSARPGAQPIRFSLAGVPERKRSDLFREFFASLGAQCEVEPLRDVAFEADFTMQALPGLMLMSGRRHGSRTHRSTADGTDDLGLRVNLGGPYFMSQCGREIVLAEGEATLVSLSDLGTFVHHPPGDVLTLRFPRTQLAALVTGAEDCLLRRIPRETPALRLLRNYVGIARDEQGSASRELQRCVVAHILDLMAVAIGATRDATETAQGRGLRAARLHAIKQDIAKNLDQPELSLGALAIRHGCTPRFVQRLFETEGTTFTEHVLAQRLACAHDRLSDPRRSAEKIASIAYDAGFTDLSYFNRAFRQRYGDTPSAVRAAGRTLN